MKQSDRSVKKISIASIKRHTIPPIEFKYSKIYEGDAQIRNEKIKTLIKLEDQEELICSTIIKKSIWSILTSRRIITMEGVGLEEHELKGLIKRDAGDFKGWAKQKYTKGFLHFSDDQIIPYFIETGNASMIMIYGVGTVAQLLRNQ